MSLDTRVAALDGLLEEAGLDAVLATKDASIAYLTGFWGLQLERFFGVAVKRGGDGALIAPSLDRESVATAPTSLDKTLYDAGVVQRPARAVRDARRRQAHRRRGGPPQLRPREGADRGRLRARPRHRRGHAPARGQGRRGDRRRQARLRAHPRSPTTSCGRASRSAHTEAETNARVAYLLARRGATALGAAHPLRHPRRATRTARPGERTLRGRRHRRAPTSPRSSTATGAT